MQHSKKMQLAFDIYKKQLEVYELESQLSRMKLTLNELERQEPHEDINKNFEVCQ